MATIAVSMIGHNEAELLPQALGNLAWVDQLIYVDCESGDNSLEVARRYTEAVYSRPNTTQLNVNKSYGFEQATTEWVFYLDPDEMIPAALAEEIRAVIASDPIENAFRLPRRNHFFGRWLRHGGQYPDPQLRLFRRGKARFPCRHVHESLEVDGKIGRLREPMDHYTVPSVPAALAKMDFYSTFNAQQMARAGQVPTFSLALRFMLWKPGSRFLRRFLFKGGFLDGWPGFIAVAISSLDFQFRFIKLWHWAQREEPQARSAVREEP